MNTRLFLLLKEHNITGLKYLCKHYGTKASCMLYPGSGTRWRAHLRKHGYDIHTTILYETDSKEYLKQKGLEYSLLYNVVLSKEFANLVPEDGSGGHESMRSPEVREKAKLTLNTRLAAGNYTEKELRRGINMKHRISTDGFTDKELTYHKLISERQLSKTMQERLGDPDYIDSRKGKTAKEIYGAKYNGPWNKGRTMNELKGEEYIDPRNKPFIITSHLGKKIYKNEREFIQTQHFRGPLLTKLKRNGECIIKRQSNTVHPYQHGETIYFEYCNEQSS